MTSEDTASWGWQRPDFSEPTTSKLATESGPDTGTNWTTFDGFVVTSNGTDPFNGYVWNTAYNANLTGGGGGLYFGGPKAKAANNGNPVPLFTPSPWDGGSSMSHLDDATYTGVNAKLMNASTDTGLGVRTLSHGDNSLTFYEPVPAPPEAEAVIH